MPRKFLNKLVKPVVCFIIALFLLSTIAPTVSSLIPIRSLKVFHPAIGNNKSGKQYGRGIPAYTSTLSFANMRNQKALCFQWFHDLILSLQPCRLLEKL